MIKNDVIQFVLGPDGIAREVEEVIERPRSLIKEPGSERYKIYKQKIMGNTQHWETLHHERNNRGYDIVTEVSRMGNGVMVLVITMSQSQISCTSQFIPDAKISKDPEGNIKLHF